MYLYKFQKIKTNPIRFYVILLFATMVNFNAYGQKYEFPKRNYSDKGFPCLSNEIYTTLDFSQGRWEIISKELLVGYITIEKDAKGCIMREEFDILNGHSGAGFSYYDKKLNAWRRILAVSNGTVESFVGSLENGKFIWKGQEVRNDGSVVLERVEMWREGSKVVNNIFQSFDDGKTWKHNGSEIRVPTKN